MADCNYQLRYLPLFYEDFGNILDYITGKLMNPQAANDLIDSVESAIVARVPVAESFEPYCSKKDRKYPYYRIYVDNFVVYYVVIDDQGSDKIMEVRRLLYIGQDRDTIV